MKKILLQDVDNTDFEKNVGCLCSLKNKQSLYLNRYSNEKICFLEKDTIIFLLKDEGSCFKVLVKNTVGWIEKREFRFYQTFEVLV